MLYSASKSELHLQLSRSYGDMRIFAKLFRDAENAGSELGEWCADRIWAYALADDAEAGKYIARNERKLINMPVPPPIETVDAESTRIREAQSIISRHEFPEPLDSKLSSKVLRLKEGLNEYFSRPSNTRCIVFVQRRFTARVLLDLFQKFANPFLRPGILLGIRSSDPGDLNPSFRKQVLELAKFRKGEVNCLVSHHISLWTKL